MNLKTVLRLVRPFTLLAPPVGTVAGALVAVGAVGAKWSWLPVLAATASGLLATGASNAWNQAFDATVDSINKPHRPIPQGDATISSALHLGHVLAVLSLIAAALASTAFLACVLIGITCTWIYSAPPWRTKQRPFGALATIALARGVLVPVAGWSVLAPLANAQPWALGAISGAFVFGAAATKDFADMDGDAAYGCMTLPVLLGPERAARWIAPFLVLPPLGYVLLGLAGVLTAPLHNLTLLSAVLTLGGLLTAYLLLRSPEKLAAGRNHSAWVGMYLLLIGQHVGCALAYSL